MDPTKYMIMLNKVVLYNSSKSGSDEDGDLDGVDGGGDHKCLMLKNTLTETFFKKTIEIISARKKDCNIAI